MTPSPERPIRVVFRGEIDQFRAAMAAASQSIAALEAKDEDQ